MGEEYSNRKEGEFTPTRSPPDEKGDSHSTPLLDARGGNRCENSGMHASDGLQASEHKGDPKRLTETTGGVEFGLLKELIDSIHQLQVSFDDKLKYDTGREAVIDRLHAELQEYKADLVLKILKPIVLDLINLHDNLGKQVDAHRSEAAESTAASKLLDRFAELQSDIEMVLSRNGFDSFKTAEDQFDPKRQRVLRSISTADAALDRRVAERVRKGFSYEGRVIRPEIVTVYAFAALSRM
jgi:molecular chaperone GrpE